MPRQIVFTPRRQNLLRPTARHEGSRTCLCLRHSSPRSGHGQIKGTTIQEADASVLDEHRAILEEAGSSIDKIVSVTVVFGGGGRVLGMNEEWLMVVPLPIHQHVRGQSFLQRFLG